APVLGDGLNRWGDQGVGEGPFGSGIILDEFAWLKGSHNFRVGFEHRRYFVNFKGVNGPPVYTFHNENTALPAFDSQTGFSFASMMLGATQAADSAILRLNPGFRSRLSVGYVQDGWKVTLKLTLNLGLRWDVVEPLKEVASRMSGLNPTAPNPGADGFRG